MGSRGTNSEDRRQEAADARAREATRQAARDYAKAQANAPETIAPTGRHHSR